MKDGVALELGMACEALLGFVLNLLVLYSAHAQNKVLASWVPVLSSIPLTLVGQQFTGPSLNPFYSFSWYLRYQVGGVCECECGCVWGVLVWVCVGCASVGVWVCGCVGVWCVVCGLWCVGGGPARIVALWLRPGCCALAASPLACNAAQPALLNRSGASAAAKAWPSARARECSSCSEAGCAAASRAGPQHRGARAGVLGRPLHGRRAGWHVVAAAQLLQLQACPRRC